MSPTRPKILSFIFVGIGVIAAVVGLTIARAIKLKPAAPVALASQSPIPRGPVQNIRFTLYDAGIFPQQQHARPGNVSIHLEDRTHQSTSLVVQRETGGMAEQIGQVSPADHARGNAQFALGVGHYIVFDASQPNNRAELIVEP
jgi:hypothetical protein